MVVAVIVIFVIVVVLALVFNRLVGLRNRVESSWAQIDVQLQRRYDLIPNLVETVKGYAAHESKTLEAVTAARNMAAAATGPAAKGEAENVLSGTLKSLFAVSEAYPDLKANQSFLQLQEELQGTEGRIAYARQFYNESVQSFNTGISQIPGNLLAGFMHLTPKEYFQTEGGPETRGPVKVQF